MENSKIEKAIAQARASLLIDKIVVSDSFVESYRIKRKLPVVTGPKLVLKREVKNGTK